MLELNSLYGALVNKSLNNLSLNSSFASFSVCIFFQSIISISSCSLLNLIAVSRNLTLIAAWSLHTPSIVTLKSLIHLKNAGHLIELSSMCADFAILKVLYVI